MDVFEELTPVVNASLLFGAMFVSIKRINGTKRFCVSNALKMTSLIYLSVHTLATINILKYFSESGVYSPGIPSLVVLYNIQTYEIFISNLTQAENIRETLQGIVNIDKLFDALPSNLASTKKSNILIHYTLLCMSFILFVLFCVTVTVKQVMAEASMFIKLTSTLAAVLPVVFVLLVELQFSVAVLAIYRRFSRVNKMLDSLLAKREHPLSEYFLFEQLAVHS